MADLEREKRLALSLAFTNAFDESYLYDEELTLEDKLFVWETLSEADEAIYGGEYLRSARIGFSDWLRQDFPLLRSKVLLDIFRDHQLRNDHPYSNDTRSYIASLTNFDPSSLIPDTDITPEEDYRTLKALIARDDCPVSLANHIEEQELQRKAPRKSIIGALATRQAGHAEAVDAGLSVS